MSLLNLQRAGAYARGDQPLRSTAAEATACTSLADLGRATEWTAAQPVRRNDYIADQL